MKNVKNLKTNGRCKIIKFEHGIAIFVSLKKACTTNCIAPAIIMVSKYSGKGIQMSRKNIVG